MKKYDIELISEKCFGLGHYTSASTDSGDGRIFVPYGTEGGERGVGYALYSDDNGKTFEKKDGIPFKSEYFQKMADGSFMAFGFGSPTFHSLYNCDYGDIPYCLVIYRAKSYDDILEGRVTTEFSIVDIPDLTWGFGDSKNKGLGATTGWRELSNGDILLTMYGHTKKDTVLCPYFQEWGVYDFYLYSTWCIVSHDKGKTWEYLSMIADCQRYPIPDINAEGYCEVDIMEVEDGHILALIRTGGHNVKSPLYVCHSYDYGKTWEAPYAIYEWGVLPRLVKMKSGRIAVITGHPDVFMFVSDDGGRTWSDRITIEEDPGDWGQTTSGYSSIFECEGGVLTAVYDASFQAKKELPEDSPLTRYVYQKTFRLIEK